MYYIKKWQFLIILHILTESPLCVSCCARTFWIFKTYQSTCHQELTIEEWFVPLRNMYLLDWSQWKASLISHFRWPNIYYTLFRCLQKCISSCKPCLTRPSINQNHLTHNGHQHWPVDLRVCFPKQV